MIVVFPDEAHTSPAVHWLEDKEFFTIAGVAQEVAGQIQCEASLAERNLFPSHYSDEDTVEYRDWILGDVISFITSSRYSLWLLDLYTSLSNDEEAEKYASAFWNSQEVPFRPTNTDEIEVTIDIFRQSASSYFSIIAS